MLDLSPLPILPFMTLFPLIPPLISSSNDLPPSSYSSASCLITRQRRDMAERGWELFCHGLRINTAHLHTFTRTHNIPPPERYKRFFIYLTRRVHSIYSSPISPICRIFAINALFDSRRGRIQGFFLLTVHD